jgi:diguanylate cyclase (GGDEF)-like protein
LRVKELIERREWTIRASHDRYQLALEASNDGILDWNLKTHDVYCTSRSLEILGIEHRNEWIKERELLALFPSNELEKILGIQEMFDVKDNFREIDTFCFDSRGNRRNIRLRGKFFFDEDGDYKRIVGSISDTSVQKRLEDQLRHEAVHDILTALPNRTLLVNRIQHLLTRFRRKPSMNAALLFIDIDNFKAVNDNIGHGFGDDMLIKVGEKLTNFIRASDTVSRFSSDVFVILLEDLSSPEEAGRFADRLLASFATPLRIQTRELIVSISVGLVLIDDLTSNVDSVLGDADIAMHAAKKNGKGRVVHFEPSMRVQSAKRMDLENALHRAIEKDELYLAYQPIFILGEQDPQAKGVEALLRWQHSERGNVAPTELLEIAEENDMISEIGLWVIRTAAKQLTAWFEQGFPEDFYININLSSRHFDDYEIVGYILAQLDDRKLPRSALRIEIVEGAVIRNPDKALGVIEKLKSEGIFVSIDDFGTGFSSLSYLHRFPFYALKIDRSFIDDVFANRSTQDIVIAIIMMAKKLGIKVVAEGIENGEQLEFLRNAGCEMGQGYLLARPEIPSTVDRFFMHGDTTPNKPLVVASLT